jgi:diguanylate cyclase (GGDEF)-like protein/PAS domain S-box-containing protein
VRAPLAAELLERVKSASARGGRHRPALWQLYLACGGAGALLYAAVPPLQGSAALLQGLCASGVLAVCLGVGRQRGRHVLPWFLLGLGMGLTWIGELYTYDYPRVVHASVPFPSLADAVHLSAYPALALALGLLVRRRNPRGDRKGQIDTAIIVLGLSLFSWVLLIAPYLHDAGLGVLPKAISVAYPVADIVLAAAAVRLALDTGTRKATYQLLGAGILCLLASDFVAEVAALHSTAHPDQLMLQLGRVSFQLLLGAAALHPSMPTLSEPASDREARLTPVRLSLLTGAVIAPMSILVREMHRINVDLIVIICTAIVLFGFVVLRMVDLFRQQERSVANERLLNSCGAALVSCTTPEQMQRAVLDVVEPLLAGSGAGVVCLGGNGALSAVARSGDGAWPARALPLPQAASVLAHGASNGPRRLDLQPELLACLELPVSWGCGLVLPLPVRGGILGVLLVACPRPTGGEVRSALEALATQLALALEGARRTEEIHRQHSEARFASLVRHASDLITVVGPDGSIVYQSPSSERVLGYAPQELLGTRFDRLVVGDDTGHLLRLLADGSQYARPNSEVIECSLRHRDGEARRFEVLHTNLLDDEHVAGIVLNARDISERKAFEEQLSHQAFHDSVTNLPNRALFVERVRHAIGRARRDRRELAVMFLDLDDFKTINDSLGHGAGDAVLIEVAKRLSASIRTSDTAARFGGDEFVVLLEDLDGPNTVVEVAERTLEDLHRPLTASGKELLLRGSIGISMLEVSSSASADELIRDADAAMYIAKRDGKGGYRLFEPEMHAGVLARLELRADLQCALDAGQFELHYQPIIRLSDNRVAGVEALLRWNHPERGLVLPDEFIRLSEETGLIIPIGRWALHRACNEAVALARVRPEEPPPYMCVNVSVKQLQYSGIVDDVRDALASSGLDPRLLTLEITESMLMDDPELAVRTLEALRAVGVRIAMDDFGTGYSSLGYLSRFPVDVIKMDRSFMRTRLSAEARDLSSAVVALGSSLDLEVVAEGVELNDQVGRLRDLGCEFGQGFHFARPMDSEHMLAYLAQGTPRDAETLAESLPARS